MDAKQKAIKLKKKFNGSLIFSIKHIDEISDLLCHLELIEDLKFYEQVKKELLKIQ